jgi:hypothetical protein
MPLLHVDLQEGFSGDAVEVLFDGKAAFRKSNVSTRTQIGFADSVEAQVDSGAVDLTVSLPAKGLSNSAVLTVSEPTYVGVSVSPAGGIKFEISQAPFGYL